MIRFFRKIRQNSLMKNKDGQSAFAAGRYFKYALGEVILVVLGILIALQINNWNEKNSANEVKKIYLQSLILELDSNTQSLRGSLKETRDDMKVSNYYLTLFNQKDFTRIKDSSITNMMNGLGNILTYNPAQSTIDDLINSGALKAMKDEGLKKKILEIKFVYQGYKQLSNVYIKARDTYLIPYFIEHGNTTKVADSLSFLKIPKITTNSDEKAFVNNKKFTNILFTLQVINKRNESQYSNWIEYLDNLAREIEKYLEND